MPFTAILPAVTLGAAGVFAFSQYRKMKNKVPDDKSGIKPAQTLQNMDAAGKSQKPMSTSDDLAGTPRTAPANSQSHPAYAD